jgi:hypothetical protein
MSNLGKEVYTIVPTQGVVCYEDFSNGNPDAVFMPSVVGYYNPSKNTKEPYTCQDLHKDVESALRGVKTEKDLEDLISKASLCSYGLATKKGVPVRVMEYGFYNDRPTVTVECGTKPQSYYIDVVSRYLKFNIVKP